MEFRPCIDIHDGQVKQIVGGSLYEKNDESHVIENFVSKQDSAFYADFYKAKNIKGGHIILLNKAGTKEYELTKEAALLALKEYPGGLQVGGGINPTNAADFINAGASHVIVTSYVFSDGIAHIDRMEEMLDAVGREHLVLDLSVRKKDDDYYIVTDRWQKFTNVVLNCETLKKYERFASEYLIHAVDVEGKKSGVDKNLLKIFDSYNGIPITYAGGVHSYEDLDMIKELTHNKVNVTIGSALDLFGGDLEFNRILDMCSSFIN